MCNISTEYKQMHNKIMAIEYLSLFVSWVDSFFQLHHLLHSQQHHFLSKCSRWIRGSSIIEFFIFLIAWGIFFECEIFIFSFSHLLFPYYELSFFLCALFPEFAEMNHFLMAHIPWMNESHDPGRPFKVAISTSAFFTSSFTTSSCYLIWETLILDLHILQLVSLGHILIFVLPFK